jgi:hypothetical protein
VAVRKFILTIGQSNGGTKADYAAWGALHSQIYVDVENAISTSEAQGAYTDTYTIPGTWPEFPTCSLKGAAVDSIRYLTFYNPCATGIGYVTYPGTARVTAFDNQLSTTASTGLTTSLKWQYSPVGRTITRERTGTTHTVSVWGGAVSAGLADQILVAPAFDPPPVIGEEITYPIHAGINSASGSYICIEPRLGDDFGTDGTWNASLAGLRVRCTSSTHQNNVGLVRYVSSITLDAGIANDVDLVVDPPTVRINFSEAFPNHPSNNDTFVIEPPPVGAVDVPFEKWAYFLPWSPIEGRATRQTITSASAASGTGGFVAFTVAAGHGIVVGQAINVIGPVVPPSTPAQTTYQGTHFVVEVGATTITLNIAYSIGLSVPHYLRVMGKVNPYPPGFNYPNHIATPQFYQPFLGESYLYGVGSSFALTARAAYHTGLANRLQEKVGDIIYVVNLAVDGTYLAQQDWYLDASPPVPSVGWFDPNQHTSWSAGDRNNLYQRLIDTLDAAKLAAQREGNTLECLGVFFVQGEGDGSFLDQSERYYRNLTTFKAQVRGAIKDAGLYAGTESTIPWVQPLITTTPWPFAATINSAIQLCAAEDRYMRTVQMDDATKISGDPAHYDAAGITLLEYRAFQLWRNITEQLDVGAYESALVVETGTGSATANSYATELFCTTYFQNQGGNTAWDAADKIQRERALMRATFWIDQTYGDRFVGLRSVNTQALEWPRSFAYDRQGEDISGVPLALQRATAEIARRYLEDSAQFFADTAAASNVLQDSVSVGPISISKTYAGTKDTAKKFVVVDRLFQVAGLIESGGWARR